jgi:tellurite resistance protein TehA-like permease
MGTGIVSILLQNLPYTAPWLNYISICFFVLNFALFTVFTIMSIIRYTLWPEIWGVMIRHPSQSLFLGTFPMGLATLINMFVFVCVPVWGPGAVQFAWAMFWVDAAIAISIAVYLPFVM